MFLPNYNFLIFLNNYQHNNIYEIYLTDKINVSWNKDFLKNISYISCKDILDNNPSTFWNDWYYLISPDQISAFKVYCDMTTDWWGWTYWQGWKINSNTNNQEFTDYIEQKNNIPADFDNLYIVPDLLINKINFSESRTIMRWETGQYSNQIKYGKEISLLRDLKLESISYLDERDAMLSWLWTINTTFNFSTTYPWSEYNSNWDYTLNCNFIKWTTRLYCWEAIDSQNPFYQEYRIRYYPEWYLYAWNYQTLSWYWVHTCIRIIKDDNTQFSATCNEQYFSNWLFTNEEKLGSTDTCKSDILSWQNSITNPSCNYRDDPNRWYEWRDWLR